MNYIENMCRIKTNQVAQENLPFQGRRFEWFLLEATTERPLHDVADSIIGSLSLYEIRLIGLFLTLLNGI